MISVNFEQILL